VSTWTTHLNHQLDNEEQFLYDHLLNLVQSEMPAQLVQRFRKLFVDGFGYPDAEILVALDKIAASKLADEQFHFILNRCCHILINRWQARPQLQPAISDLVTVFKDAPARTTTEYVRSRSIRRLRELVKSFVESEQYLTLWRLSQVFNQPADVVAPEGAPLGSLIRRYPYLYEHCLLTEGASWEQQQSVRNLQAKAQRQYEIDLSQYVTYQVRRSQLARTTPTQSIPHALPLAKNPTLLGDRDLCVALRHFAGRSQGSGTYRDLAQRFMTHTSQARSFREFKADLYEYLTASVAPEYGKRQFNKQLHLQLKNLLPDSDAQKPTDFLIVRVCSQLLGFLTVENPQNPQHFVLVDLVSNLGPTLTTGLLLKIVLICRKVKPYLEKRFSILFNHYETFRQDTVVWLVEAMENLNVALSTNFSTVDLSFVNQVGV